MKSRIKIAFSTGLLVPVFIAAPVLAVDSTTTTTATSTETTSQTDSQNMQARVQKRKDELKLKLTTLEQNRLKTRCKNSQGAIKSLQGRITGIETSRTEVYKNLVNRLTTLQGKLDSKGADTAELKTEIATLQTKITTFNTDLATYKQTVSDLAGMDCAADPTGFKASLQEARTQLKQVHDDGVAIKSYVNDTIKPTLQKIRASLDGTKQDSTTAKPTTTGSN